MCFLTAIDSLPLHTLFHTLPKHTLINQHKTMIKNPFCRPRLRPSAAAAKKSDGFSPMTLLDRLREAVFRLIMISALSKGSNAAAPRRRRSPAEPPSDHFYYPSDHHHTEAVADCIEFIKKSVTADDDEPHHRSAAAVM